MAYRSLVLSLVAVPALISLVSARVVGTCRTHRRFRASDFYFAFRPNRTAVFLEPRERGVGV